MKKVLIAIPYLNSGGVEVSLIRFLKEFSKTNNVDLLMLKKEGMYLKDVPRNVKIIEVDYDKEIYSFERKIKDIKIIKGLKNKLRFLFYRFKLKKCLKNNDWSSYYKLLLQHVNDIQGDYDLAIDWHGYGHFITSVVADKVNASKKAFWVHDEKNEWITKVDCWLDKYDKIYCVSVSCRDGLLKKFPFLKEKTDVFYNLSDYKNIRQNSLEKIDFVFDKNVLNIVTVGRLEWQKGYDVAVNIAALLKKDDVDFCWYIIGEGSLKDEINAKIKECGLVDNVKLLGIKKNPFPYIKEADFYLQPSRHEGYGLAIMEAKILGVIPIATNLKCISEQITDGKNGFLCKLDSKEFADKIIEVYNDKRLMKRIKENLSNENFNYNDQFEKLYKLTEE